MSFPEGNKPHFPPYDRGMAKRKPTEVLDTLVEGSKGLDVGDLAAELMQAFGGPRKFASLYYDEFQATTGAVSRSKLLEGVLRIVTQASAANKDRAPGTGGLSDQELMGELVGLLKTQNLVMATPPDAPEEAQAGA